MRAQRVPEQVRVEVAKAGVRGAPPKICFTPTATLPRRVPASSRGATHPRARARIRS